MHLVPFQAENPGEHVLDEVMPVEQAGNDLAAGATWIGASRLSRWMATVAAGAETLRHRVRVTALLFRDDDSHACQLIL